MNDRNAPQPETGGFIEAWLLGSETGAWRCNSCHRKQTAYPGDER